MKTVKVTIHISEQHIQLLSHWASVSRTLNEAQRLLTEKNAEEFEINECLLELMDLEPALDHLHGLARTELWKIESKTV